MISINLISAARKSEDVPNDYSEKSLEIALERYRKFLQLVKKHRSKSFAPSKDIDMMWHLHMLSPRNYYQDCMNLFGDILDHDGGFGSVLEEEEELKTSFEMTAKIWEEEYGEQYIEPGQLDNLAGPRTCRKACLESCSIKCH